MDLMEEINLAIAESFNDLIGGLMEEKLKQQLNII